LISKPRIEATGSTINRKFPFKPAFVARKDDPSLDGQTMQAVDDVIYQISQNLTGVLEDAPLSVREIVRLCSRRVLTYCCVTQREETDALMERLSSVGSDSEKRAMDFLLMVARVVIQFVDSFKTEARRKNAGLLWDVDSAGTIPPSRSVFLRWQSEFLPWLCCMSSRCCCDCGRCPAPGCRRNQRR
jgi:hypothetical protein